MQKNIKEAIEPKEKSADGIEIDERVEVKRLYKTTRYLHYVMKFIIRSRILFSAINDNSDHDDFANKLHGKNYIIKNCYYGLIMHFHIF